ncbi:hypothetical protein [Amycolatopsis cihanbeyliensis]|uniref:Uncharacterized protein n=1 Tax=Amycolatopsis cihanbeyliensis TaxID=1128664 RepID=A0A542DLZ2_AMYCI|nr:hypothetical protein [Amycolatopsis cihanbeyliensis]TQJ04112.1 hypothetical protein FB471_3893 [Amycolatopsis cihanbeyliensis]
MSLIPRAHRARWQVVAAVAATVAVIAAVTLVLTLLPNSDRPDLPVQRAPSPAVPTAGPPEP